MGSFKDLTGMRFGRLTVIERMKNNKSGKVMWLCRCDCGNIKPIRGCDLKRGNTKSCGCLQKEISSKVNSNNLIGQRFGRLTVVSFNEEESNKPRGKSGYKVHYWNCKCDCGVEKPICSTSLINGSSKSCGCLRKELIGELSKERWQDEEFREMESEKTKKQWENEEFRKIREDSAREQMKERWENKEWRDMQSKLNSDKMKQLWQDEQFRKAHSGENSHLYNLDLTDEEREADKESRTNDAEFIKWSYKVKEQANFTCDCCNNKNNKLNSHHLNNWNTYREQRYNLENGVCLCEQCHKEFHKWMGGTHIECTKEDYIEFKNNRTKGDDK